MSNILSYLKINHVFNNRIAIARVFLALNALLTLLFNNIKDISNTNILGEDSQISSQLFAIKHFTIFEMFGYSLGTFISVIILLAVLTGYYPRITIIFQTWVHLSLCNTLILIEGGDQVASNLSLLLIPICILDSRKNQWDNSTINNNEQINIFSNIYYFLIRLQIAVIYLHAGIGKLAREEWLDGTCLYYWCTHSVFGAPNYLQKIFSIITLSKFTPIFSWAVIFLEIGLFSCILATNKSIKRFFLFSGVLFHFGIMLTHGLVTFFCSMVGALILYLDNENIIYKICKTIKYKIHGIKL